MKLSNFIIATVVGTSAMTLYSYLISKKEKQEFTEPILLNKLIDRSEDLPEMDDPDSHPAGWLLHYGLGALFVISYRILWRNSTESPSLAKSLVIGAVSGSIGIGVWKVMFSKHHNPPKNERYKYYRQLFVAHLIFSTFALFGYKLPDYIKQLSSGQKLI